MPDIWWTLVPDIIIGSTPMSPMSMSHIWMHIPLWSIWCSLSAAEEAQICHLRALRQGALLGAMIRVAMMPIHRWMCLKVRPHKSMNQPIRNMNSYKNHILPHFFHQVFPSLPTEWPYVLPISACNFWRQARSRGEHAGAADSDGFHSWWSQLCSTRERGMVHVIPMLSPICK